MPPDTDNPQGIVFDIKEFAIYDGPGVRCSVFLKGCPLRCRWCHNPEGIESGAETAVSPAGVRTVGKPWLASDLAETLLEYADILDASGGGITFTGGEPLFQPAFLLAVMSLLKGRIHQLVETSGYAGPKAFAHMLGLADQVYFDLKLIDPAEHRAFTARGNRLIHDNLRRLDASPVPYRIRMPLIPGVTDREDNYRAVADFVRRELRRGDNFLGIDLLPYNRAAGGKYVTFGKRFSPGYNEQDENRIDTDAFSFTGREVRIL